MKKIMNKISNLQKIKNNLLFDLNSQGTNSNFMMKIGKSHPKAIEMMVGGVGDDEEET